MDDEAARTSPLPPRRFRRLAVFCLGAAFLALIVLVVLVHARAKYSPPSAGLIAWWSADGNADDSVGGHHGILRGGMGFMNGVYGQAFAAGPDRRGLGRSFRDYVNSFLQWLGFRRTTFPAGPVKRVYVPDSPVFQLISLTMGAWINASGPGHVVLFRGDNRTGLDPYQIGMDLNSGRFHFTIQDATGGVAQLFSPGAIPLHEWVQYTATLDASSGDMRIYMDGVLLARTNTSVRPFLALDPSQVPGVGIGNVQDLYDFPFNGGIDEVVLYNRALSPAEVLTLATKPGLLARSAKTHASPAK